MTKYNPDAERRKPPSQRGRPNVPVTTAVYARLFAYAEQRGLLRDGRPSRPQAVAHALDVAESPVVPAPVPWERIQEALLSHLGTAQARRIETALREAGMP